MPQKKRVGSAAAVLVGASLALASPVHAQAPGGSAVNQYVELVPAAGGPKSPGIEKKARTALPTAGKEALKQAPPSVAGPLEEIATSSTYGAPAVQAEPKPIKPKPPAPAPGRDPDTVDPRAPTEVTLGTTVSAIASATDERLLGLLFTLLMTTLGAVALAVRRARGF